MPFYVFYSLNFQIHNTTLHAARKDVCLKQKLISRGKGSTMAEHTGYYHPPTYLANDVEALHNASISTPDHQLRYEWFIENCFGSPIFVVDRDNVVMAVPPSSVSSALKNNLIISKRTTGNGYYTDNSRSQVKLNFDVNGQILEKGAHNRFTDLERIERAWYETHVDCLGTGGGHLMSGYKIEISERELKEAGGVLYVQEFDVVIALRTVDVTMLYHPYSRKGLEVAAMKTPVAKTFHANLFFSVEIVDNANYVGDQYINLGGRVFHIKTKKDPCRRCGYYFRHSPLNGGEFDVGDITMEYFPITADKTKLPVCLWATYKEAEEMGDEKVIRQRAHEREIENAKKEKLEQDKENVKARSRDTKLKGLLDLPRWISAVYNLFVTLSTLFIRTGKMSAL